MSGARSEWDAILQWSRGLPTLGPGVRRSIGDDGAWLDLPGITVVSTDAAVEGVHFRRDWLEPEEIGWRVTMAALSDLAASRACPSAATLTVCAGPEDLLAARWLDAVVRGVGEAAREAGCPIVGGDTTRGPGPLVLSLTVLGRALSDRPLGRDGATPGDLVLLSGPVGRAAIALRDFAAGIEPDPACRQAWARPRARLDLLPHLAPATAGIDVSDGLLADAGHLARASGVALRLDLSAIGKLLDPFDLVAEGELVLSGGDDYELLITAPRPLPGFAVVGTVEAGQGLRDHHGRPLPEAGWDHMRRSA